MMSPEEAMSMGTEGGGRGGVRRSMSSRSGRGRSFGGDGDRDDRFMMGDGMGGNSEMAPKGFVKVHTTMLHCVRITSGKEAEEAAKTAESGGGSNGGSHGGSNGGNGSSSGSDGPDGDRGSRHATEKGKGGGGAEASTDDLLWKQLHEWQRKTKHGAPKKAVNLFWASIGSNSGDGRGLSAQLDDPDKHSHPTLIKLENLKRIGLKYRDQYVIGRRKKDKSGKDPNNTSSSSSSSSSSSGSSSSSRRSDRRGAADDSSSSKSGTLQLEGEWHADCNMAVAPVQLAISSDALPALLQATVDLAEEWKRKQVRRASNQIRVASLKYVQYVLIMYGQACVCVSFRYAMRVCEAMHFMFLVWASACLFHLSVLYSVCMVLAQGRFLEFELLTYATFFLQTGQGTTPGRGSLAHGAQHRAPAPLGPRP